MATGRSLGALEGHNEAVWSVAWSPDGTRLASGSRDGTVRIWTLGRGRLLEALEGHTKAVWSVAWSPDGTRLASAGEDKGVRLWESITERRACQLAMQVLGPEALQRLLGAERGAPRCANPDAIHDLPSLPLLPS